MKKHKLSPLNLRRKQRVIVPISRFVPPRYSRNKKGECKVCRYIRIAWDYKPCKDCINSNRVYPHTLNTFNYFEVAPKYLVDFEIENVKAELEHDLVALGNEYNERCRQYRDKIKYEQNRAAIYETTVTHMGSTINSLEDEVIRLTKEVDKYRYDQRKHNSSGISGKP